MGLAGLVWFVINIPESSELLLRDPGACGADEPEAAGAVLAARRAQLAAVRACRMALCGLIHNCWI